MVHSDAPHTASALPVDDEVEDAFWLAGLIRTLQIAAERRGHPEIAVALNDVLDAAQKAVRGRLTFPPAA